MGATRARGVLPGFGITLGYTLFYLSAVVLIPLAALIVRSGAGGLGKFKTVATDARTLSALKVSFGASLGAAAISTVLGFLVAWVLVRYRFPGKRLVDALVDLPFAMPTAVSGLALATLYGPTGWIGQHLPESVQPTSSILGIILALIFIGMPFIVRTLQPALQELEPEVEEAAASLGATRWGIFRRILFPTIIPALLTGFALAFARGVGEYGSVIFVVGTGRETEFAPLLIVNKLDEYDYAGAAVVATVMLVISFVMLLVINTVQWWALRRVNGGGGGGGK